MSQQSTLTVKSQGQDMILYEILNYSGYIPDEGDWITYPHKLIGRCTNKVLYRDLEFKDSALISVTIWV